MLQLLQSGILSLQPSGCVPALTPSTITSRPTISSRPSKPHSAFLLCLRFGYSWPLCSFTNYIYLLGKDFSPLCRYYVCSRAWKPNARWTQQVWTDLPPRSCTPTTAAHSAASEGRCRGRLIPKRQAVFPRVWVTFPWRRRQTDCSRAGFSVSAESVSVIVSQGWWLLDISS